MGDNSNGHNSSSNHLSKEGSDFLCVDKAVKTSMEEDSTYCVNCKRDIPSVNFVMHNVHCSRNITLCTLCEEPIPHIEMDAHRVEFHSLKECELCGEKMDLNQLKKHKTDSCPLRRINCSICELELSASEITEHENYCGSRTELCEVCGEYVMLKYQKLHVDSNHKFLKLDDEPGPKPSWQINDKGPMNNLGAVNNDLRSQRKVMNSVSGIGVIGRNPMFVSSSPSKRTNDMPQVNSVPPPHTSKAVHKATIMGDSDKPLKNLIGGEHVVGDVAVLFNENLHLTKTSHSRPTSAMQTTYSQEDDLVALPCEFCEALVPANQLILHQTACRPDLARYDGELTAADPLNAQSPGTSSVIENHSRIFSVNPSHKIHNNLMTTSPSSSLSRREVSSSVMDEETLLPCELCHKCFSVSHLYDHQTRCTVTRPEDISPNGQGATADSSQINPLQNVKTGSHGNEKNLEFGATKMMLKEDQKSNVVRHNRLPKEIKREAATSASGVRDLKHRLFVEERSAPKAPRTKVWPHHSNQMHPDLNEFEEDEGRLTLLNKAKMMDRINSQMARMKDPSTLQRNHVMHEMPLQLPHYHKQPNHFNSAQTSSHTRSYPSSSNHPQSGRDGRTTGAIPKKKAGASKSPIAFS